MGNLKGDRMYQICEEGFKGGDLEYFGSNIRQEDLSGWFRLAVQWDNYVIADLIREMGYDLNVDNRIVDELIYCIERGFNERIAYLIECGLVIDYLMMERIIGSFTEYRYLHSDEYLLDHIKMVYRGQKIMKLMGKMKN